MSDFPNFSGLDAVALESAPRRTFILALIGNLSFVWCNNESLFIHLIEALVGCNEACAVVIFASLVSTRSRIELIERLGRARLQDPALWRELETLLEEFGECTKVRNEFNHCMYTLGSDGALSHTQSFRIRDVGGRQALERPKPIDDARIDVLVATIERMKVFNRRIFEILPRLRMDVASN